MENIQLHTDYVLSFRADSSPIDVYALLAAVMMQALLDIQVGNQAELSSALHWVMRDSIESPFAFRSICGTLGLNHNRIRQVVRDYAARSGSRKPAASKTAEKSARIKSTKTPDILLLGKL